MQRGRVPRSIVAVGALFVVLLVCRHVSQGVARLRWDNFRSDHDLSTQGLGQGIEQKLLGRYTKPAEALSNASIFREAVVPDGRYDADALDQCLRSAWEATDASLVYLMNRDGTVVACTEYGDGQTLTGQNYAFRPYFTLALAGNNVVYPALGVTTGRMGLYFSSPIRRDGRGDPVGVIVLKVNVAVLEKVFARVPHPVALVGPNGVVLASNRPQWRRRLVEAIAPAWAERIRASRQFDLAPPAVLDTPLTGETVSLDGRRCRIARYPVSFRGQDRLIVAGDHRDAGSAAPGGLRVVTVRPVDPAYPLTSSQWQMILTTVGLLVLMIVGVSLVAVGIVKRNRAEAMLRDAHDTLERCVAERTEQLERTNTLLADSERRFRDLFEQSNDAIVVHRHGTILEANGRAADLLGYPLDDLPGLSLREVCVDRKALEASIATSMRTGSNRYEARYRRSDDTFVDVEISARAMDRDQGIIQGVARDITDRKRAEREMRTAMELAESANRAKSAFLANMSHEIRTPLNGIIGMADLLRHSALTDEQRRQVKTIHTCGQSLLTILNDVLDLSKIEAGRLELDGEAFDPRAMLDDLLKVMAVQARQKHLRFTATVDPAVPDLLYGDPGRIRQVLMNLISNAIKFTDTGGVTLRVDRPDGDDAAALVRFSVTDTGIGVPPDKRETIFEAFSQVDGSSTRRHGGTGLGLAICRQLVEVMGGRIGLDDARPRGTTFWFVVPLAGEGALAEAEAAVQDAPAATDEDAGAWRLGDDRAFHVLVAEDNAVNQAVVRGMLRQMGVTVDLAGNGAEAVAALRATRYDLVLMDVQMPEMDGLQATAMVRDPASDVLDRDVPIVALSAHAFDQDRRRCRDAGMNDYLAKPLQREQLVAVLARVGGAEESVPELAPDPPAAGGSDVLDLAGALDRLDRDQALLEEVLAEFAAALPAMVETVQTSVTDGDEDGIARGAHSLKGAARQVGANRLAEAAAAVEQAAGEGPTSGLSSLINELNALSRDVRRTIDRQGAA
ncbi:MAG: ATP-binding protein [Planctomycetota bacterium]